MLLSAASNSRFCSRPQRRLDHAPIGQHDPLLERGAPPDAVHALGV